MSLSDWMLVCAPLALVLMGVLWLFLTRVAFKVPRVAMSVEAPALAALLAPAAPWTRAQRRTAVIFLLTIAAWIFGRKLLILLGFPPKYVTDATIAMAGATALWLVPAGRGEGALLRWTDSVNTPWPILLLFGGGLAIADGFASTGLSAWLGQSLAALTAGLPFPVVMLIVIVVVTAVSEVTSNTATATLMLPVVGALAQAMHLPAVALMMPATVAASCCFVMPVATPPNAIVYASGRFRIGQMTRAGLGLDLICAAVVTGWMLLWGGRVLGF